MERWPINQSESYHLEVISDLHENLMRKVLAGKPAARSTASIDLPRPAHGIRTLSSVLEVGKIGPYAAIRFRYFHVFIDFRPFSGSRVNLSFLDYYLPGSTYVPNVSCLASIPEIGGVPNLKSASGDPTHVALMGHVFRWL